MRHGAAHDAKTHLARLADAAANGEPFIREQAAGGEAEQFRSPIH